MPERPRAMRVVGCILAASVVAVVTFAWHWLRSPIASDGETGIAAARTVAAPIATSTAFPFAIDAPREVAPPHLGSEDDADGVRRVRDEATGSPPQPDITVRVVDDSGRPVAGVPVGLGVLGTPVLHGDALGQRARTDRDGLATFPGAERTFDRFELNMAAARCAVFFAFLEREASLVVVDLAHPPAAPVELVLHASGRLRLRFVDAHGAPVRPNGRLTLRASGSTTTRERKAAKDFGAAEFVVGQPHVTWNVPGSLPLASDVGGEATVEFLGLGLALRLDADVDEYPAVSLDFPGPTRPGETVEQVVALGVRGPVVTGRLFRDGPQGSRALRGGQALVQFLTRADDPFAVDCAVALDDTGRFRCDASRRADARSEELRGVRVLAQNDRTRGFTDFAQVDRTGPLRGDVDLGDLALRASRLLVAGRVVTEGGTPPRWPVEVRAIVRSATASQQPGPDPLQPFVTQTAADGSFSIDGEVATPNVVVKVSAPAGFSVAPCEVAPGRRDLVLVLERCGHVSGRIALDPQLTSLHLAIFLRRADPQAEHGDRYAAREYADGQGRFAFFGQAKGVVDLVIGLGRYSDRPRVLARIEGVAVAPGLQGDAATDVRLDPLDLRSLLLPLRVELEEAAGAPLEDGEVVELADGQPLLSELVRRGAAILPVPGFPVDLEVRVPGREPLPIRAESSPVRVRLTPGPEK